MLPSDVMMSGTQIFMLPSDITMSGSHSVSARISKGQGAVSAKEGNLRGNNPPTAAVPPGGHKIKPVLGFSFLTWHDHIPRYDFVNTVHIATSESDDQNSTTINLAPTSFRVGLYQR
jgi:hypothetical protein